MKMAPTHTICTIATLPPATRLSHNGTTTDGHSRLFVSTWERGVALGQGARGHVLVLDPSSRRWRRFATLPLARDGHCAVWHAGLLYVAGGVSSSSFVPANHFHVFSETTGSWEVLPPMPRP